MGKSFDGVKKMKTTEVLANDTPLPLKDILEDSLATKNQGTDFLGIDKVCARYRS